MESVEWLVPEQEAQASTAQPRMRNRHAHIPRQNLESSREEWRVTLWCHLRGPGRLHHPAGYLLSEAEIPVTAKVQSLDHPGIMQREIALSSQQSPHLRMDQLIPSFPGEGNSQRWILKGILSKEQWDRIWGRYHKNKFTQTPRSTWPSWSFCCVSSCSCVLSIYS